jgi:hypothetical protein
LFKADGLLLNGDPLLQEEVFGPSTVVVEVADAQQLAEALRHLQGQLTATLIAEPTTCTLCLTGAMLERKAGRLLLNGYPTGVEVCDAMVHGGPYPATSDARGTSVGTLAIDRFLRPVCFQNYPDALLPDALQNANPLGLPVGRGVSSREAAVIFHGCNPCRPLRGSSRQEAGTGTSSCIQSVKSLLTIPSAYDIGNRRCVLRRLAPCHLQTLQKRLVKNAALLVTMDGERREIKNGGLFIEGNLIKQVGPSDTLPQHADVVLDMAGKVVIPGLVNTPPHVPEPHPRGTGSSGRRAVQLADQPVPDLGAPDPEMIAVSTQTAMAELILSGCTTSSDHLHLPQRLQARRQHPRGGRDRHALPRRARQHERGAEPRRPAT